MDNNQTKKITKELEVLMDFASAEEWNKLLWEWFKITMSGSYHQLSKKEKKNMIAVYEKLDEFFQKICIPVNTTKNSSTNL